MRQVIVVKIVGIMIGGVINEIKKLIEYRLDIMKQMN